MQELYGGSPTGNRMWEQQQVGNKAHCDQQIQSTKGCCGRVRGSRERRKQGHRRLSNGKLRSLSCQRVRGFVVQPYALQVSGLCFAVQLVGNHHRRVFSRKRVTWTCCSCQVNSDHQVVKNSPGHHHATSSRRALAVAIECSPAGGMDTGPVPVPMCYPVQ